MAKQPEAQPRWYAVVFWGLLSVVSLPLWAIGVLAGALKYPLRYSTQRLNEELHGPAAPAQPPGQLTPKGG